MAESKVNLKPCPFCGCKKINLFKDDPFDGYHGDCSRWTIGCSRCDMGTEDAERSKAIKKWNKRTPEGLAKTSEDIKYAQEARDKLLACAALMNGDQIDMSQLALDIGYAAGALERLALNARANTTPDAVKKARNEK